MEKGIATHSTTVPWRIPRTEEPEGLQPTVAESLERAQVLPLAPLPSRTPERSRGPLGLPGAGPPSPGARLVSGLARCLCSGEA